MDVKSTFLNGVIQEEVFVRKAPGFENPMYPNRLYKLSKALYGLKQAPQAWYARLKTFLLEHGYVMGSVDKTPLLLIMAMPFYLFRFAWMISSLVALLMCLCQVFKKSWRMSSRCP
jgi:hypothetical protein